MKLNINNLRIYLRNRLLLPALLCVFTLEAAEPSSKIMHLSFDDGFYFLMDLKKKENTYKSIFENPFLGKLKSLHDEYGAVFSIYCFTYSPGSAWNIGPVSTAFADEFVANSDWLKLGFHSRNSKYEASDWQVEYYDDFLTVIPDVEGRSKCFDLIPRLHTFGLNTTLAYCDSLKNHEDIGLRGFLTTDDSRVSYYLTSEQAKYINSNDSLYDAENDLYFFKTETRLESVKDIDAFLADFLTPAFVNKANVMPIFTHEHAVCNLNSSLRTDNDVFEKMETCIKWAIQNNYKFDYPMNVIKQSSNPTVIESQQMKEDDDFLIVNGKSICSVGQIGTFKIYNVSGAMLFMEENASNVIVNLAPGFYVLKFEGREGKSISKRIIIQ